MDLQTIATLGGALIVAKIGYTITEKIIWDWLKVSRNGKNGVPSKASDMAVTHEELDYHCEKTQGLCVKSLEPRFQLMVNAMADATMREFKKQILPWLEKRDASLEQLEKRTKDLEVRIG